MTMRALEKSNKIMVELLIIKKSISFNNNKKNTLIMLDSKDLELNV